MNIVTIFERAEDVHLNKDVGQILYYMSKYNKGNAELWTFYDIKNALPGVEIKKIKASWTRYKLSFNLLFRLIRYSKDIALLNLYHVRLYSLIYAYVYKVINPKGVVFIKGDFDLNQVKREGVLFYKKNKSISDFFKNHLVNKVDFITYEHRYIGKELSNQNIDCFYLPNGLSEALKKELDKCIPLEHIDVAMLNILIVGRIGSYQKNTEEALEIITRLYANGHNIHVNIVGPISAGFQSVIEAFYAENLAFCDHVKFVGEINDIKNLASYYNEADIFLLTSRFEGYPLSVVEAGYASCIPVVSENSGADDLIENNINGYIYKNIDDAVNFIDKLMTIKALHTVQKMKGKIRHEIIENNNWEENVILLLNKVNQLLERKCE